MAKLGEANLSVYSVEPSEQDLHSSASPVILLHGMTSAKETWKSLIHKIADATGRKVYSFDARNHGDSFWSDSFDYDVMVDDLSYLMKQLDIPKAVLIGHSMGGKTAMYFALQQPGMIEKLVIEDITPKRLPPSSRKYPYLYMQQLKQALKEIPSDIKNLDAARKFVASYFIQRTPQEQCSGRHGTYDASVLPLKQNDSGEFQWKTNLSVIEQSVLHGFKYSHETEGLFEEPVLFLYGTKSAYSMINDKDFILKLFPKATFRGIEGAGHQLHLEYPEEFLEAIIPFLNDS